MTRDSQKAVAPSCVIGLSYGRSTGAWRSAAVLKTLSITNLTTVIQQ